MRAARPSFEDAVRSVVVRLRPGDVATYGEIAEEAGYPGAGRAVGRILATSDGLPWWRVVTSTGRLVPGHETEAVSMNLPFDRDRVRQFSTISLLNLLRMRLLALS